VIDSSFFYTFAMVFAAEFGDKSQLVCMALAARYRAAPVLFGTVLAFVLLNLLAVSVGGVIAQWVPQDLLLLLVAVMFGWFGVKTLRADDDDEDDSGSAVGRSLILSVMVLMFMAELGDKTQLAVAGLAAVEPVIWVWFGGTLALVLTSTIGVIVGRTLLQKVPVVWLHRIGGGLFILFSLLALWQWVQLSAVVSP